MKTIQDSLLDLMNLLYDVRNVQVFEKITYRNCVGHTSDIKYFILFHFWDKFIRNYVSNTQFTRPVGNTKGKNLALFNRAVEFIELREKNLQ